MTSKSGRKSGTSAHEPKSARREEPGSLDEGDPEYRIAYDVAHHKVGCVLIQAALGGDVPRALFYEHFGTGDAWTVNAGACKIYPIRQSQLPTLAARTSFDRQEGK